MKASRLGLPISSSPSISTVTPDRERAGGLVPGAQRLEPQHDLAFVVDGAAGVDALAVRAVDEVGLEGRVVPEVERLGGLDVVMAVEQQVRGAAAGAGVMGEDDGVAGGGADARR